MALILLFALIFVFLVFWVRFGRPMNAPFLLAGWWLGWAFVAQFSLLGVDPPSTTVSTMVIVMVASYLAGALLPSRAQRIPSEDKIPQIFGKIWQRRFIAVTVVLTLFFVYLFLTVRDTTASVQGTIERGEALDAIKGLSVFGKYSYIVLEFFIMASTTLLLVVGSMGLVRGKTALFTSVAVMAVASTLAPRNRFPIYVVCVLVIVGFIIAGKMRSFSRRKTIMLGLVISVVMGALVLFKTAERQKLTEVSMGDKVTGLVQHALNYHTVGFQLMTQELETPDSLANTTCTFGRSTIGGLEDIWYWIVWIHFSKTYQPVNVKNFTYRNEFLDVGVYGNETINANAFYTVLHTLYLDGRWAAIAVFPAIFGALLARRYWRMRASKADYELVWVGMYMFIGLFSLFQSPLEEGRCWSAMIILAAIEIVPRFLVNKRSEDRKREKPARRSKDILENSPNLVHEQQT